MVFRILNICIYVFCVFCGVSLSILAQNLHQDIYSYQRPVHILQDSLAFNPALKPFYHGVASGDPLTDRVILWTRITPDQDKPIEVQWFIATDVGMLQIIDSGSVLTDQSADYTVKVDAKGLKPNTTYYYAFRAMGLNSITGRTKTAPAADAISPLRFAVASCANYQQGYFNAYARIAERSDLNAVIFLGDYIYEYAQGAYGYSDKVGRGHVPAGETVSLSDYRIRYSFYRLDPDVQRVHQMHPFIGIWDDHESANDSYPEGAENHNPATQGDWQIRKANAKKAYFEWLPIRQLNNQTSVYRKISYGGLCDLLMLDTRLEGRDKQLAPKDTTSPAVDTMVWYSEQRTLLGKNQFDWLLENLSKSQARWKVLGNQVMMMPVNGITNQDAWDGYPAERKKILSYLQKNALHNTVVITGDIHSTWAGDIPLSLTDSSYNPATGQGSAAVEFVTPSISSANLDEIYGTAPNSPQIQIVTAALKAFNPHLKGLDVVNHGYFVLSLDTAKAQADWYFVDSTWRRHSQQRYALGFQTLAGTDYISRAVIAFPVGISVENPADTPLKGPLSVLDNAPTTLIIGNYPNPFISRALIHYTVRKPGPVTMFIHNSAGELVYTAFSDINHAIGPYVYEFNSPGLAPGMYTYTVVDAVSKQTRSFIIQR